MTIWRRRRQSRGRRARGDGVEADERISFTEGECVQMLHVGPYEKEGETVAQMLAMATSEGREVRGRHHEIYLSDPRRVEPERLRTILRLPVRRK
jgi:hypothetical protein